MVLGIRVLAEEDEGSRDNHHEKQDESERRIQNEKNDASGSHGQGRCTEDVGEDQQADAVEKVDDADGNVERVGALVHPRSENRGSDERSCFKNDESDGLGDAAALGQCNKHRLDEGVDQHGNDKVVRRGAELDVEESPFVQGLGIREQDVGRVAVHSHRATGNAHNLVAAPAQGSAHAQQHEDGKNNQSGGVDLSELPKTEDGHLGEPNEGAAEENALEDSDPAVSEVKELVALQPSLLGGQLKEALEGSDSHDGENDKEQEEDQSGHEKISRLNAHPECHTLDTVDKIAAVAELDVAALGDGRAHAIGSTRQHGSAALEQADSVAHRAVNSSLLDLHGMGPQAVEDDGRLTACGALVPGEDCLHEPNPDDSHRPLEVLGPSLDDRREGNSSKSDNSLRLEETEEGERVGSNVGSGVGVTEAGDDSRRHESQTGDNCSSPLNTNQVDSLGVGKIGLKTSNTLASVGHVDENLGLGVKIRNGEGDSGDHVGGTLGNVQGEGVLVATRLHGAETLEFLCLAGLDLLVDDFVAVGSKSNVKHNVTVN